jgi:hypothetical protein
MSMRQKHRNPTRTRANTIEYGRTYELKETAFEALVHHGTNVVHRKDIETRGLNALGDSRHGHAIHCTLDREDAVRWAWASIRRDRNLVSDPCGEELWPMLATLALTTDRTLIVRGWDWDLPKTLAYHLGVPKPECDDVDQAVMLLDEPLCRSGIEALVCLSPGRPGSNEVTVYRAESLTMLSCRTLTEIRRR